MRFDTLTPINPCRRGAQEGARLAEPCQGTRMDRQTDRHKHSARAASLALGRPHGVTAPSGY